LSFGFVEGLDSNFVSSFLNLCLPIAEDDGREDRMEAMWRILICDSADDDTYPAPEDLKTEFRGFVTLRCAVLHHFLFGRKGRDFAVETLEHTLHPFSQDINKGTMPSLKDVIKLFLSVTTSCERSWDETENEALLEAKKRSARFALAYERHGGGRQPFRTSQKLLGLATFEVRAGRSDMARGRFHGTIGITSGREKVAIRVRSDRLNLPADW
jgi:hypothetical protein